jgi:hypothetical protein
MLWFGSVWCQWPPSEMGDSGRSKLVEYETDPPVDVLPSFAEAPPVLALPPVADLPPAATAPPLPGVPPVPTAPPLPYAPPVAAVPPLEDRPPVAEVPPMGDEPPRPDEFPPLPDIRIGKLPSVEPASTPMPPARDSADEPPPQATTTSSGEIDDARRIQSFIPSAMCFGQSLCAAGTLTLATKIIATAPRPGHENYPSPSQAYALGLDSLGDRSTREAPFVAEDSACARSQLVLVR